MPINSNPGGVVHYRCANPALPSITSAFLGCAQHDLSEEQWWLMAAKASECAGDLSRTTQTHHFEKWLLWEEKGFLEGVLLSEFEISLAIAPWEGEYLFLMFVPGSNQHRPA